MKVETTDDEVRARIEKLSNDIKRRIMQESENHPRTMEVIFGSLYLILDDIYRIAGIDICTLEIVDAEMDRRRRSVEQPPKAKA